MSSIRNRHPSTKSSAPAPANATSANAWNAARDGKRVNTSCRNSAQRRRPSAVGMSSMMLIQRPRLSARCSAVGGANTRTLGSSARSASNQGSAPVLQSAAGVSLDGAASSNSHIEGVKIVGSGGAWTGDQKSSFARRIGPGTDNGSQKSSASTSAVLECMIFPQVKLGRFLQGSPHLCCVGAI
jgi:hypothetical protein